MQLPNDLSKDALVTWYIEHGVPVKMAEELSDNFSFSFQPEDLRKLSSLEGFRYLAGLKDYVYQIGSLIRYLNILAEELPYYVHIPETREGPYVIYGFVERITPDRDFLAELFKDPSIDLFMISELEGSNLKTFLNERGLSEYAFSFQALKGALRILMTHNDGME